MHSEQNEMLLNIIDGIDDVVCESEYDVLDAIYEEYHKTMMIYEYASDLDASTELITEGVGSVVKAVGKGITTILKKIWHFIKAIFAGIGRAFKKLFGIKDKTENATATPNQVLDNMVQAGEIKPTPVEYAGANLHVHTPNSGEYVIPYSPSSDPEFHLMKVKLSNAAVNAAVHIDQSRKMVIKFDDHGDIKEKKSIDDNRYDRYGGGRLTYLSIFFNYYHNQKSFDDLSKHSVDLMKEIIKLAKNAKDDTDFDNAFRKDALTFGKTLKNLRHEYNHLHDINTNSSGIPNNIKLKEISMDQLLVMQKSIDETLLQFDSIPELCDVLDKFNLDSHPILNDFIRKLIDLIDHLSTNVYFQIQRALNIMTISAENIWVPNQKYFGIVQTYDELDHLAAELVKQHIPQKGVMKTIWLCCAPNLRGDGTTFKPIWGQMRGVLIPPNQNYIYKVALSERSRIDLKSEARISDDLMERSAVNIIARVIKHTDNYGCNVMEKVNGIGEIADKDFEDVKDYVEQEIHGLSIQYNIEDLHRGNIGFTDKKAPGKTYTYQDGPKILDYAMAHVRNS